MKFDAIDKIMVAMGIFLMVDSLLVKHGIITIDLTDMDITTFCMSMLACGCVLVIFGLIFSARAAILDLEDEVETLEGRIDYLEDEISTFTLGETCSGDEEKTH